MKLTRLLSFTLLVLFLTACMDPATNPNQAPHATITANPPSGTAEAGVTVFLDGSGSTDLDGSILGYEWSINGDFLADVATTHATLDQPGVYRFALTVTDDDGLTHTTGLDYTVLPASGEPDPDPDPDPTPTEGVAIHGVFLEEDGNIVLNYGPEYELLIETYEAWELDASAPWLSFERMSGEPEDGPYGPEVFQTVRLEFDPSELPVGTQASATITLTGLTSNEVAQASLELHLPDLEVESSITLNRAVGRTERATFTIANAGPAAPLNFEIDGSGAPWLHVEVTDTKVGPGSAQNLTLTAACESVAETHQGRLIITSNDPRAEQHEVDVEFNCLDLPDSRFEIYPYPEDRGEFTDDQWAVVESAAARWSEVIVGDLEDVSFDEPTLLCGQPEPVDFIDDILIFVEVVDGFKDGAVAKGGPCGGAGIGTKRGPESPDAGIPYAAIVSISRYVLEDNYDPLGFEALMLHEFAHALGLGSMWHARPDIVDGDTYIGVAATEQYRAYLERAGRPDATARPPIETGGGPGTAGAHWQGSTFGDELMTGSAGSLSRLSRVTVGAMEDLGYEVNYTFADFYQLPYPGTPRPEYLHRFDLSGDVIRFR